MLVFYDARPRDLTVGVVHYSVALMVGLIQYFCLKTHCAVVEFAKLEIKILVDRACVDNLLSKALPIGSVAEEIGIYLSFYSVKQAVDKLVVSTYRDALVAVVEIVVVEDEPHGQALDDKRRQVGTLSSPLLLRISFDEPLVDVTTNESQSLLLKIAWLLNALCRHILHSIVPLFFYFCQSLSGSGYAPHLVKCVHVERQIVELAFVVGHRRIGISVELNNGVDEVPYFLAVGVEDVGSVFMYVDAFNVFAIHIAA